jgi:hypothetical protein
MAVEGGLSLTTGHLRLSGGLASGGGPAARRGRNGPGRKCSYHAPGRNGRARPGKYPCAFGAAGASLAEKTGTPNEKEKRS